MSDLVRVLEVNINDVGQGGAWAFVKNAIEKSTNKSVVCDFFTMEEFENSDNIRLINELGGKIFFSKCRNKIVRQFKTYFDLKKLVKEEAYDIVHIHSDLAFKLLIEGMAAKHAGAENIILHSHCTGVDRGHRLIKRLMHEFSKPFLKFVGTDYFACSNKAGHWMYSDNIVESGNYRIINNSIDCSKFRFNKETRKKIRNELSVQENALLIGHVGRFMFQKNHDFLIDIFFKLREINDNAILLLIGEGELEEKIRNKVKKLKLEKYVIFLGVTNHVNDYMQAMDVFVLPSWFEGLPVVGIEAQASGLPCIMSDTITEETNLFGLVEFFNLNDDPLKCAELINNICKKYERKDTYLDMINAGFDINNNSLIDIYKQIISTGKGRNENSNNSGDI